MSKTYVIADLHGRFDLLEVALTKIANHVELPATLVTLGDYVDRGPDSRKVIERLMGNLGHEGWRFTCLKGNEPLRSGTGNACMPTARRNLTE
jgi:serine/threonine protein phosphatase 1